jgi:protein-S-isoprenylcysteine O-methyltransferase Ste14
MALAGALQTTGVGLWHGSWIVIAMAQAGAVVWHLCIRPAEEADMATRFGTAYQAYRAEVRCWVPVRAR